MRMKRKERKFSTRLIRKGALIEETYAAFRNWDLSIAFRKNIESIRENNPIGAANQKWLHEILTTLSSRFEKHESIEPLVLLARGNLPIYKWRACLLWHIGNLDEIYYSFATEWLFPQYREGAYLLRTEDALPFVRRITDGRTASGGKLSEYGALRAARDLLRMASDFGLLEGKVRKRFANYHLPQEAFMYVLHGLSGAGFSTSQILSSKDWRLFLLDRDDVERELFRLHQYKVLEYHVAGSMTQLRLPRTSLKEYARELMA